MQKRQSATAKIPLAEKLIASLGMVLVLATFAFLFQRAIREQAPPQFVGRIEAVVPSGDQFIAKVSIKNSGGTPVANLMVTVDFGSSEKLKEVTIDYLPSQSARQVGFVLHARPKMKTAKFDFVSYSEP